MLEDYMQWTCNVNNLYKIPWPFNAKEWQNSGHRTCIPSWMHSTVVRRWIVLEVLQVLRPQPHILIHGDCSLCYCHGSTYSLCSLQFSLFQTLSGLHYSIKKDEKKGTLSKIQASYNQYLVVRLFFSPLFPQRIFKTSCGWSTVLLSFEFNKFSFPF